MSDSVSSSLSSVTEEIRHFVQCIDLWAPGSGAWCDHVHHAPRLLTAVLPLLEQQQWQDIETAPKDGTECLVAEAGVAVWAARYFEHGWWEVNNHPSDSWGRALYPTHWMPLPDPPPLAGVPPPQAQGET